MELSYINELHESLLLIFKWLKPMNCSAGRSVVVCTQNVAVQGAGPPVGFVRRDRWIMIRVKDQTAGHIVIM